MLSRELQDIMILVADLPERWQKKAEKQLIDILDRAEREASEEALPVHEKRRVRDAERELRRAEVQRWLDRINAAVAEVQRRDREGW
jgi:predicted RNA-binding protein